MSVHSRQTRDAALASLDDLSVLKRRIVELLLARPDGLTREEIADEVFRPLSSICGRVAELEKAGLVVSTADTRPTRYGRHATIVRIKERPAPVQLSLGFD